MVNAAYISEMSELPLKIRRRKNIFVKDIYYSNKNIKKITIFWSFYQQKFC